MNDDRSSFAEDLGLLLSGFGLARMVGRVLGILLISDPPERTAEDLADALRASRGSISSSTRALISMGLVQRVSKPGERRDYFRVKSGGWDQMMRREMDSVTTLREIAERGLRILESDDPKARRNLEEMRDVYAYWERKLPGILNQWELIRKQDKS